MLAQVKRLLKSMREWLDGLPALLKYPLIYLLGYFGIFKELLKAFSWAREFHAYELYILTVTYTAVCLSHYVFVILQFLKESLGWTRVWLDLDRPRRYWVVPIASGLACASYLLLNRGDVQRVRSPELLQQARGATDRLEQLILQSLTGPVESARERRNFIEEAFNQAKADGEDRKATFERLQKQYAFAAQQGLETLVMYHGRFQQGTGGEAPAQTIPKVDPLPPYLQKILAESQGIDVATHLTWTPLGYLVVSSTSRNDLGTLVVAKLWSEGAFFEAAQELWRGQDVGTVGHGLLLLTLEQEVTYATELSEYGDRLLGEKAIPLESEVLHEIALGGRIRYVFQRPAQDPRLSGVLLRSALPVGSRPPLRLLAIDLLAVILLAVVMTVYLFAKSEPEPAAGL